jgi:hypothetical protein
MSRITLSKNHTWEDDRKSLSLMKKIIPAQSTDKTGFVQYRVSKYKENFVILKMKILAVTEFSLSLPGRNVDVETVFTRKCLVDGRNKLVTRVHYEINNLCYIYNTFLTPYMHRLWL